MKVYDVFISYRRSDGLAVAEELYRYLTARGLRVFFDLCEMVDGHYFTTQIETQLRATPNYVLVATNDVFRFRDGEDWVRREIEIALETYEQHPTERSLVVLTNPSVCFPAKEAMDPEVRNIADVQRVVSSTGGELTECFERILTAVTQVSHQNLWRAAHRWLENSKRPGGRFANLSIADSLLPNAEQAKDRCDIPVTVWDQPVKGERERPLFEAVSETEGHLFLIGQGGIGKTTALMHLMNAAYVDRPYSPNAQIPIFVELSFAPDVYDTLYENGKSSFIRRSIFKQLRMDRTLRQVGEEEVSEIDEVFMLPYKVAVAPINDILSHTSPAPEYLLLLDGLNEVSSAFVEQANSTVVKMIVEEINMLMTQCPNVRVVLTSRSDEISVSDQPMRRFYLSGVNEDTIRTYLEERHVPEIDRVMDNSALVETLKIPLFLTLYGSLENREAVSSQGEIFRLFFNERRRNISVYTVQDRLAAVEKNIYDTAGMSQRGRLTAQMQYFILDFLLPEIAWHMERQELFYLRPNQIAKIMQPILEDITDTAVCGDFGKEVFTKYQQGSAADVHTQKVAEDILERLGPNITKCTEKIINCCTMALGVLQGSGRRYGFIHQHVRDYFAALKNINTLRLAVFMQEEDENELALTCMNEVFRDEPVRLSVRRFLGETLGEHHNHPVFRNGAYCSGVDPAQEDRTLLSRALNIYRNKFRGEGGYGQHSLLKILSEVRGSLAGCDLSRLDLTGCHLNGAGLGVFGLAANVEGAKIRETDLFFQGHKNSVKALDYSPDGRMILSGSTDGQICIWDAKTGAQLLAATAEGKLLFAGFVGDGSKYVTASWGPSGQISPKGDVIYAVRICLWNTHNAELLWKGYLGVFLAKLALCPERRCLLVYNERQINVVSLDSMKLVLRSNCPEGTTVKTAGFSGCSEKLLVALVKKTEQETVRYVKIWDLTDASKTQNLPGAQNINFTTIAHCGQRACAVARENQTYTFLQMDPENGETKTITDLPSKAVNADYRLQFSDSRKWLALIHKEEVRIYDANSYLLVKVLKPKSVYAQFSSVSFYDSDRKIAVGMSKGDVLVYETNAFSLHMKMAGAASGIYSFEYSPEGKYLATFSNEGGFRLWDTQMKKQISSRKFQWGSGREICFAPDGKTLCLYSYWQSSVLSVPNLETVFSCDGEGVFSPDGKYFAAVHRYSSLVFKTDGYEPVLSIPDAEVKQFLNDCVIVENVKATLSNNCWSVDRLGLTVVDIKSGAVVQVLDIDGEKGKAVAANGGMLAVGSEQGAIRILDSKTYETIRQYRKPLREKEKLYSLKFSNNGQYLFENTGALTVVGDTVVRENRNLKEAFRKTRYAGTLKPTRNDTLLVARSHELVRSDCVAIYDFATMEAQFEMEVASYMGHIYAVDDKEEGFALREQENRIGVYRLERDGDTGKVTANRQWEISIEPGLDVLGVDLRKLHPDSHISKEHRDALFHYGALID